MNEEMKNAEMPGSRSEMSEISALAGNEGYGACGDEVGADLCVGPEGCGDADGRTHRCAPTDGQRPPLQGEAVGEGVFDDFLEQYPEVHPADIPDAVWLRVAQGVSLTEAWAVHENQRLRAEIAALRQSESNRRRTPGSLGGSSPEPDEIDRFWNEV